MCRIILEDLLPQLFRLSISMASSIEQCQITRCERVVRVSIERQSVFRGCLGSLSIQLFEKSQIGVLFVIGALLAASVLRAFQKCHRPFPRVLTSAFGYLRVRKPKVTIILGNTLHRLKFTT